jgi:hypothetical protein
MSLKRPGVNELTKPGQSFGTLQNMAVFQSYAACNILERKIN